MGVIGQWARVRADLTAEDAKLILAYAQALRELVREEPRFESNLRTWGRWTNAQCLAWIYYLEEQADKPEPLPLAVKLTTRVAINRLTS